MPGAFVIDTNVSEGEHLDEVIVVSKIAQVILDFTSLVRRIPLEREAKEGKSPVFENHFVLLDISLEYHGK